jgi:signal recognition particle receptor subunit beta
MVLFNYATRELTAKIVYYGPGLCGKTTNLEAIHRSLPEKTRGKMLSLATQTDRTLFFDFLPLEIGSIKGMKTRVQLYTVPGQVFYDATRKLVLKGADGIVFVADSQVELLNSNLESWANLKQNLAENGLNIRSLPVVIQYNKRDLANVLPVKVLDEKINELKAPFHEAIAITGMGVQETLKTACKVVLVSLAQRFIKVGREALEEEEELEELEEVQTDPATFYSSANLSEASEGPTAQEFQELEELEDAPPDQSPGPTTVGVGSASSSQSADRNLQPANRLESNVPVSVNVEANLQMKNPADSAAAPNETQHSSSGLQTKDVVIPVEIFLNKEGKEIRLQIQINLKINLTRE